MTLGQLLSSLTDEDGNPRPITYDESRVLALVFTPQLAARLGELWQLHGSNKCKPVPVALTDGRLMLCADVLTEVQPGGMLHAMWEAADKTVLNASVEVIQFADAVALLPPEPTIP
jgi:hypothetical protein